MKVKVLEDDILVSSEMLAKIYGVSTRSINLWTQAGCPKHGRGVYSLKDVARWRGAGATDDTKNVENMTLAQQKMYYEGQHRAALAELQQMKVMSLRGELLRTDQITEDLRRFCGVLKKELQALGREIVAEIAPEVSPETAREMDIRITGRIKDALRQMSAGEFRYDEE